MRISVTLGNGESNLIVPVPVSSYKLTGTLPKRDELVYWNLSTDFSWQIFWVLHIWLSEAVTSREVMRSPDQKQGRGLKGVRRFWATHSLSSHISQLFFIIAVLLIPRTVNDGGEQSLWVSAVSYIVVRICTTRRSWGKTGTEFISWQIAADMRTEQSISADRVNTVAEWIDLQGGKNLAVVRL